MRLWTAVALLCVLAEGQALAQSGQLRGGPISFQHIDRNTAQIDTAHRSSVRRAPTPGRESRASSSAAAGGIPKLEFPLRLRPHAKGVRGNGIANFVDLDPTAAIKDFTCAQRTYNGHSGIDFVLFPYWWRMMDGREAEIVAAAPGVITDKQDGKFDRQCKFASAPANYVVVRQDDGLLAYYWHMKNGSVTKRSIGARVERGENLGYVGSSGVSLVPHLHFELRTAAGALIDPFAGICGRSRTLWRHQPENVDTDVLRLATHTAEPKAVTGNWCDNPNPAYADKFAPGSKVWAAAYVRDLRPDTQLTISIIRPDGQVYASGTSNRVTSVQPFSYWYISRTLPAAPKGRWKLRAVLEGKTYEHTFIVGKFPGATTVQALVQPQARSIVTNKVATFEVEVRNTGAPTAVGCVLALDTPLAAVWHYQAMQGSKVVGTLDPAFDLESGAMGKFRLTIRPTRTYAAYGSDVPLRIVCDNAQGPEPVKGFNILTLSFQDTATPDIVAEVMTDLPDGVLTLGGANASARLVIAGTNLGATGRLIVSPRSSRPLPLKLSICHLDGTGKVCRAAPASSVTLDIGASKSQNFRIVAKATGNVPFDFVDNRILVEFVDTLGITRGATSVAVTTVASSSADAFAAR